MKTRKPRVTLKMQNYHYERRDNNKTVKVNTDLIEERYRFFEWLDQSPDSTALEFLRNTKLTRLTLEKEIDYQPTAKQSLDV